jgi:ribosomal protein L34E
VAIPCGELRVAAIQQAGGIGLRDVSQHSPATITQDRSRHRASTEPRHLTAKATARPFAARLSQNCWKSRFATSVRVSVEIAT